MRQRASREGTANSLRRYFISLVLISLGAGFGSLVAALIIVTPALAQETIPFTTTKDKKLIVKVKVEGIERTLILDTGAVDLVLDPSVVGMKLSDLKPNGRIWNPNGSLKFAERRVTAEFGGRKFKVVAAILDCKPISDISGTKVDGIIGMVILQQFKKVSFDFENSRLELR
jgi:hypothetical protein